MVDGVYVSSTKEHALKSFTFTISLLILASAVSVNADSAAKLIFSPKEIYSIKSKKYSIEGIEISPDDNYLISNYSPSYDVYTKAKDSTITEIKTGKTIFNYAGISRPLNYEILTSKISPNGRYVFYNHNDTLKSSFNLIDVKTNKVLFTTDADLYLRPIIFSADSRLLAISEYHKTDILDTSTGKVIRTVESEAYQDLIYISLDGKRIILKRNDVIVCLDIDSGNELYAIKTQSGAFPFSTLDPKIKNNILLLNNLSTSNSQNTYTIFNATTGQKITDILSNGAVKFNSNGKYIISYGYSKIKIIDANTGSEMHNIEMDKQIPYFFDVGMDENQQFIFALYPTSSEKLTVSVSQIELKTGTIVKNYTPACDQLIRGYTYPSPVINGTGKFLTIQSCRQDDELQVIQLYSVTK